MWGGEGARDRIPIFKCFGGFQRESGSIVTFKYSLSSLETIYIFTDVPPAPCPCVMRFTLFGCPTVLDLSTTMLREQDEMQGETSCCALLPGEARRDVERCPRALCMHQGGDCTSPGGTSRRTIRQTPHEVLGRGVCVPWLMAQWKNLHMTQPFPEGSLVLEMIIWLSLGTGIPRISKPQKEGVEVTSSSSKGGNCKQELRGRQMQEHLLLHAARSPLLDHHPVCWMMALPRCLLMMKVMLSCPRFCCSIPNLLLLKGEGSWKTEPL